MSHTCPIPKTTQTGNREPSGKVQINKPGAIHKASLNMVSRIQLGMDMWLLHLFRDISPRRCLHTHKVTRFLIGHTSRGQIPPSKSSSMGGAGAYLVQELTRSQACQWIYAFGSVCIHGATNLWANGSQWQGILSPQQSPIATNLPENIVSHDHKHD